MKTLLCPTVLALLASASIPAQNLNPDYRINRTFYTSMWTANPPEYTTAGQTVPAGTMHWRAFVEQTNQRLEPRRITGIGAWWQASDLPGTFPANTNTLEYRIYPTTFDINGLVVPDDSGAPQLTVPAMPLVANSNAAFNSLTISFGAAMPVSTVGDFALCAVYPAGASSTLPGYFGLLPSGANETYRLAQSYYGFLYSGGAITHFGLGGARSSLWITEDQPTLSVRSNWGLSAAHYTAGYLNGAWGESSYFSPLADPAWPGWTDGRSPATTALTVYANGMDGTYPVLLLNFGSRFPSFIPFAGLTLELLPADPLLTALSGLSPPITNGRSELTLPLFSSASSGLAGTYFGFEAVMFDLNTFQLVDTTQSVWIAN